jgi:hypothetical protein
MSWWPLTEMNTAKVLRLLACIGSLAVPLQANAAETGGCGSFAWPLATEVQWLKATDSETLTSGGKLPSPPAKAIALTLQPVSKISFPVAPTSKRKAGAAEAFGGIVNFDAAASPGLYQVTLASNGWVDVVQNVKALHSSAHTGKSDCDGVRKSVRFDIQQGPFSIELSGIAKDAIKFAIRRAE